jgi:restriction system protein
MATSPTFPNATTLWVVHIGNNDRIALRARDEGFVCIGWAEIGDLSSYNTRAKMRQAVERTFPAWKPKTVSSSYGQPFRFAHEMKVGDPLVFPVRPTGEIAIGRIAGLYEWSSDPMLTQYDTNNVRPVEWLKIVPRTAFSQAALHSFGSFLTISTSDDYLDEVRAILLGQGATDDPADPVSAHAEIVEEAASARNLYETAAQETEDYLLRTWQRTGAAFEEVVAALFQARGYTATVTPASGDHGVDVIAHPDPLGLERPYIKIQVKSGSGSVGEPDVHQLRGLLHADEQGVLVSLGRFSGGALAIERNSPNLTLIGPKRFVRLFLDHYDRLSPEWRAKFPLRQVFVPFS